MSFRAAAICGVVLLGALQARAAARAEAAPSPRAPANALADLDPANDDVVAPPDPIADCEAKLQQLGVVFAPAELPVTPGNAKRPTCGAPQAVVYRRGPAKIRYNSQPVLSCGMALGLARFEQVLNEEAERYLGQEVARVEQGGTYNCRKMARFDLVSEHSYANAIDIRSVTLKNGRKLSVLATFGRTNAEPQRPEARFWRSVANRLYDEGAFSVVITPFFDGLHKDHIHLDQARYRLDGSRPSR
ncbi:MAG: extensin family protein [Myxococcales bacterium]